MKVTLLLVGKTTSKEISALVSDYAQRLTHYLTFDIKVLPDLKNTKNLTEQQIKDAEGKLILAAIEPNTTLLLLDEHGKQYRSIEFAQQMAGYMQSGKNITFLIGGPYGFSEEVYQRANGMLSLSKMTFSHQMVRLIFIEQLYRAMTILKGEKYHHE